jgi:polyhydroxybutyrate depolymerase
VGHRPPPAPAPRLTGVPRAARPVAVVLLLAIVAGGCAWMSDEQVDVGVAGVSAQWLNLSRFSDRRALVITKDDGATGASDRARPLVVVLPGLGSNAEFMARISGWAAAAHEHDLIVAIGQGTGNSFNAGGCCGTAVDDDVDDVAYVDRVIGDVSDNFPVDRARVFLTGYSNGGMMTYRYLCEGSRTLAGAASVAGTNTTSCTPRMTIPFLQVSGAKDPVVPIGGGTSSVAGLGPLPPVLSSVSGLANAYGCPQPVVRRDPPVTTTRWSPCRTGITVGFDILAGVEHGYPLAPEYPATERILAFWGVT